MLQGIVPTIASQGFCGTAPETPGGVAPASQRRRLAASTVKRATFSKTYVILRSAALFCLPHPAVVLSQPSFLRVFASSAARRSAVFAKMGSFSTTSSVCLRVRRGRNHATVSAPFSPAWCRRCCAVERTSVQTIPSIVIAHEPLQTKLPPLRQRMTG